MNFVVCEIETFENAAQEGTCSINLFTFFDEQDIIVLNIAKLERK